MTLVNFRRPYEDPCASCGTPPLSEPLFRCGVPTRITSTEARWLLDHARVSHLLDLRSASEIEKDGAPTALLREGIGWIQRPIGDYLAHSALHALSSPADTPTRTWPFCRTAAGTCSRVSATSSVLLAF